MKRKIRTTALAVVLSSSVLFSSCIGSFTLFRNLLTWNNSLSGDIWVNELMYFLLWIVPVYEVTWLIDGLILNTIEFWSGDNPADPANFQVRQVETEKGLFTITADAAGYKIQKTGSEEAVEFRFNKTENSWSLAVNDQVTPLLQFVGENRAKVYLADGSTMTVTRDQAGVMALRRAVGAGVYFAEK